MRAGRKPLPSHLAIVDKAHKNRHIEQLEASDNAPVAPDHLSVDAKRFFDEFIARIETAYTPSESHTDLIVMYAEAKERATYLESFLKVNGLTQEVYTMHGSYDRVRPEVMLYDKARSEMKSILLEFGLSPISQKSVSMKKITIKKNAFSDLDD